VDLETRMSDGFLLVANSTLQGDQQLRRCFEPLTLRTATPLKITFRRPAARFSRGLVFGFGRPWNFHLASFRPPDGSPPRNGQVPDLGA
jgi:hypothetical protein